VIVMMFAAGPDELADVRVAGVFAPASHGLPAVDLSAISPVALVSLDSAITGDPVDGLSNAVLGNPLEVVDDGEQLLFAVRPELTAALAALDGAGVKRAAQTWAATEEMVLDRWTPERCRAAIAALAELAVRATPGAGLYTWLST
jgi:hypothetical protein